MNVKNGPRGHDKPSLHTASPQSVNSTSDPCYTLHEWLVFPLRGSTEFYAAAATFVLRVHAAQESNSQCGLKSDIRLWLPQCPTLQNCILAEFLANAVGGFFGFGALSGVWVK